MAEIYLGNKPHAREASQGLISLAQKEGEKVFKRALLCRTGQFDGMFGPVTVTKELLEKIASFYNRQRANPLNDFDLAPILVDHNRAVELIQGRIMPGLNVESWVNPENSAEEFGLYADLRLDDPDAPAKVKVGKFAQLSITFDESTGELFEVSFVAVEAARRSQLLSKGEHDMNLQQQFDQLSLAHKKLGSHRSALQAFIASGKTARLALVKDAQVELAAGEAAASQIPSVIKKVQLAIATIALRAQIRAFAYQGKITKAEFDEIKFEELAAQPKTAQLALVNSYQKRPVDVKLLGQFGQANAEPVDARPKSPEQMRKAMELQKAGKSWSSLAEGEEKKDSSATSKKDGENKDGGGAEPALKMEDLEEYSKCLEEVGPMVEKIVGHGKKMGEMMRKLMESDDKKEPGEGEVDHE